MQYDYRPISSRDALIVDGSTGAIVGVRSKDGVQMFNGVSTNASLMGGSRKTLLSGELITIPANSQSVSVGGVTVNSGASVTCFGEFVALKY